MSKPFNPLALDNLGHSISNAILGSDPTPLGAVPVFTGAGVYAIYYRGAFSAYERVVARGLLGEEHEIPIYVGKAVPAGGRRGVSVESSTTTRTLSKRLREHAGSIQAAENLDLADVWCRWLVVEPIWIPLGESILISRFAPVWNTIVDGFGNHDPGSGRRGGVQSRWDVIHPGRAWVVNFAPRAETPDAIAGDVRQYMEARYDAPVPE